MANEYLKRTPTSTGNRKKWTWAGWVKINKDFGGSDYNTVWSVAAGTSGDNSDRFHLYHYNDGRWVTTGTTSFSQIFTAPDGSVAQSRDPAGWMHICLSVDTTLTSNSRDQIQRFWVNGVEYIYDDVGNVGQNVDLAINGPYEHHIGTRLNSGNPSRSYNGQMFDLYLVDGQALTPDVFGFYKDGKGYQSSGTQKATDFRSGQWSPRAPKSIKYTINRGGGFGVNGFYLPMNDSSNPGADFHCAPNSIIKLKGEDLPQPRNGAPTTSDAYVSELRQETGALGFDGVCKFDGDTDTLEFANSTDFEMQSSDFCMEAFIFTTEIKNAGIFGNNQSSGSPAPFAGYEFDLRDDGALDFYSGSGTAYDNSALGAQSPANVIKTGRWYHIAAVRNGNNFRIYVDGSKVAENTSFTHTVASTNTPFRLGSDGASVGSAWHFNGLISNARIVKGSPVYTANFTPPTEPLTAINNTKLLCCQSSTDASTVAVSPGAATVNSDVFATRNELTGFMVLAVPGIALENTNSELITNGTFDSNISGWSSFNSVLSHQTDAIRVADNGSWSKAYQAFTTVVGKSYSVKITIKTISGNAAFAYAGAQDPAQLGGNDTAIFSSITTTGTYYGLFTATATTSYVEVTSDSTSYVEYSEISVKEVMPVRDYSADIKGSGSNKTLTANGDAGVGYGLGGYYGSAMTFDGSGDYFDTPESNNEYDLDGDYTIEFWVNFNSINNVNDIIGTANNSAFLGSGKSGWVVGYANFSNIGFRFGYQNNGSWIFENHTGVATVANQWNHVAITRYGSTQQIIINGVVGYTETQANTITSTDNVLRVGGGFGSTSALIDAQIQDLRIYKGVAKYKGGFDVPKPYTSVGIEAFRTTADTCTNNFATFNPLVGAGIASGDNVPALSDGNLYYDNANQSWTISTHGVSSGKYYAEFMCLKGTISSNVGVCGDNRHGRNNQQYHTARGISYIRLASTSITKDYNDTGVTETAGDAPLSYESGSIVGITIDCDNREIKYYKNGTLIRTDSTPASYTPLDSAYYFLAFRTNDGASPLGSNWSDVIANFGQNPTFSGTVAASHAGTNTDGNGKGLFKYDPPSGFLALCEDNLPTPTIADPGKYFKTVLYSGDNSAGRRISDVGFQPDLVWIKARNASPSHILTDSVRGIGHQLSADDNGVEVDSGTLYLTGFADNGFDLSNGANSGGNTTGRNYVAWCWKAGGPAVTNNDGSITTQISVSQKAGFSIGTYTGNLQANQSIGHGLGQVPSMIIVKERTGNSGWGVYHRSRGNTKVSYLNATDSEYTETTSTASWGPTDPTSDVFYVGNNGATNDNTLVFYAWSEIKGFSKFGSYVGTDSDDGNFVYCGFKPAFVMVKNVDILSAWIMVDSSRDPYNPCTRKLFADTNGEENVSDPPGATADTNHIDLLSNGFKLRKNNSWSNYSNTYIFAAFAESPFKTANAK